MRLELGLLGASIDARANRKLEPETGGLIMTARPVRFRTRKIEEERCLALSSW